MDMSERSERVKASINDYAAIYGVSAEVHPDDHIFRFIHDDPNRVNKEEAVMEYFQSGRAGAAFVKDLLDAHPLSTVLASRPRPDRPMSVLEFASGYGRVTRHFPKIMPDIEVTACDIHTEAVNFLRGIGFEAYLSAHTPESFDLGRRFDVIYAFSFFTHMPRATWTPWLAALGGHLAPGGVLLMTAHGIVSQKLMDIADLDLDGFFFHAESEQKDLAIAEYGNTITSFDFVYHQLAAAKLRLLQFRESGAGQHDLYILTPDPEAPLPWGVQEGAVEVDAVRTELEIVAETERRRARAIVEDGRRRAEQTAATLETLRRELAELHASRSWKITAPLRAAARAFAGRG